MPPWVWPFGWRAARLRLGFVLAERRPAAPLGRDLGHPGCPAEVPCFWPIVRDSESPRQVDRVIGAIRLESS